MFKDKKTKRGSTRKVISLSDFNLIGFDDGSDVAVLVDHYELIGSQIIDVAKAIGISNQAQVQKENQSKEVRLVEAIGILRKFNPLHHDLDAYLFEVTEWALGKIKDKPNPKDYGIC
jgi:hypothetical protein